MNRQLHNKRQSLTVIDKEASLVIHGNTTSFSAKLINCILLESNKQKIKFTSLATCKIT